MDTNWHIKLFNRSVLKQQKFREVKAYLGDTAGLTCLDVGSDNGVISYFLRKNGGTWYSADMNEQAVDSIRQLVESNVYKLDFEKTPFENELFDKVAIVDYLEHIHEDKAFIEELNRIMKSGGELIINVPLVKFSILRKLRHLLGQTDEKHGHVRPGYTKTQLRDLLGDKFQIVAKKTYVRSFSEFVDTIISCGYGMLEKGNGEEKSGETSKGVLVTEDNLKKYKKTFYLYSLIYPFVWLFSKLDALLFFQKGYMLMVRAIKNDKKVSSKSETESGIYPETPDIETSSDEYAGRFSGKVGQWFLKIQAKATLRMLADRPNATVLDVGGGHGQLLAPLLEHGYKVTVLGSSDECRHRIQSYIDDGKCEFKVGSMVNLPFEDRSFDVITSFRLVPHIEQWPHLLAEFARVARYAIIFDYPTSRSINFLTPLLFGLKKKYEKNTRHYILFREKELLRELKKNDFVRKQRYAEFFLPMVFHRALKIPAISAVLEGCFRLIGATALLGSPVILHMTRK